jgi:hypothetical protein
VLGQIQLRENIPSLAGGAISIEADAEGGLDFIARQRHIAKPERRRSRRRTGHIRSSPRRQTHRSAQI